MSGDNIDSFQGVRRFFVFSGFPIVLTPVALSNLEQPRRQDCGVRAELMTAEDKCMVW